MNVVIAALSAPAQLNGVSRHAANIARALLTTDSIDNVHFLAGEWQQSMFRELLRNEDARLHLHSVSMADANFSRLLWYLRELPYVAAQLDADLVHMAYPAPIQRGQFDCPTVLSLHDLYPFDIPENFGFWKSALARRTMGQCIRRVDAIACVSANTQGRLAKLFPFSVTKAMVIPNVVEVHPPTGPECSIEQLNGRNFILCVAQHRSNKNVPIAIQVFARALRNRILPADSRLVVVGISGPDTRKIEAELRGTGLGGMVLLSSGLSDGALQWCYENCSALLAPSKIEGFGLPVAEGMLSGCRIVCSEIPAFLELGDGFCHFVPWGGDLIGSYTDALARVLTLPKPRAAKLPRLSPASVGREYAAFYQNLIFSRLSGFGMLRQPETATRPSARQARL
jgi:glycosyltransferase involved in cell wall biosynthesis